MILRKIRVNNKGVTLIELVLTILFLSIAFPLILYSLSSILEKITIKNVWNQKAAFLAASKMEQIIADPASAGNEDIYNPDAYYPGYKQSNSLSLPAGVDRSGPWPESSSVKQYKIEVIKQNIDDALDELNLKFKNWNPSTNTIGDVIKNKDGSIFKPVLKFTRYKVVVSKYMSDGSLNPLAELNLVR